MLGPSHVQAKSRAEAARAARFPLVGARERAVAQAPNFPHDRTTGRPRPRGDGPILRSTLLGTERRVALGRDPNIMGSPSGVAQARSSSKMLPNDDNSLLSPNGDIDMMSSNDDKAFR